jgi:hypothetical protein
VRNRKDLARFLQLGLRGAEAGERKAHAH